MLRRLIALVLTLSFSMYYAEALIADVHDGDATAVEQAVFDGATTGAHQAASVHTDGPEHERTPVHPAHTCHAGHAHTCVVPAIQRSLLPMWLRVAEYGLARTHPLDLRLEPQLRPPIA